MSSPSRIEREQLDQIAFDVRETFVERGHRVETALEVDPSFGSGRSRSSLMNDLVMDTVSRSASRLGLSFCPVNGSGRELIGERHRYRVRKAKRDSDNNLVVTVSSESALGLEEEPTLFPMESWVFGWVSDGEGLIAEVFIAEILGIVPGMPGRLILGEALPLGSDGPFNGGFTPAEEDLDLDEDDDLDEGGDAGDGLSA